MALSIPSGTFWGGNNGNWSTFRVTLGISSPMDVDVLPSFLTSQVWVPTPPICNNKPAIGTVTTSECYNRRGGTYDTNNSREALTYGIAKLPISGRPAIFGTDNVTFGDPATVTVGRTIVAGYTTLQPFLGNFGLSGGETTLPWDTPQNATSYGILPNLWKQGQIGSRVWGCNVGASYRNTPASLTFGGYDANRGNNADGGQDVLTVPMNADPAVADGDLLIEVRGVGIGGVKPDASFVGGLPVTAVVDSLVPDMFLPDAACDYFEKQLGLVWDSPSRRYFINQTQHEKLLNLNSSISIALGIPGGDRTASTTITLPYAAFDLNLTWPLNYIMGNATRRYFPLVRVNRDYYLGRAFLQEVYLAADYERRQFNVSQARWPADGRKDIRKVVSSNTTTTVTEASDSKSGEESGLSSGTITGIALGVVAALALLGLIFWFLRKRKRAGNGHNDKSQISRPKNIGSSSFGPRASTRFFGTPVEKSPAFTLGSAAADGPHPHQPPLTFYSNINISSPDSHNLSPALPTGLSASSGNSWRTTTSGRHELSTPPHYTPTENPKSGASGGGAKFSPDSTASEFPQREGWDENWKNPWILPGVPVEMDTVASMHAVELPAQESEKKSLLPATTYAYGGRKERTRREKF